MFKFWFEFQDLFRFQVFQVDLGFEVERGVDVGFVGSEGGRRRGGEPPCTCTVVLGSAGWGFGSSRVITREKKGSTRVEKEITSGFLYGVRVGDYNCSFFFLTKKKGRRKKE